MRALAYVPAFIVASAALAFAEPPAAVVETTRGNTVRGALLDEALRVSTAWGEVDLPAAAVLEVRWLRREADLRLIVTTQGDRWIGFMRSPGLRLGTADQELLVPWGQVARLSMP